METVYYVLTNNELLEFCTASTITGVLMTLLGLRLSANPKVRGFVIGFYHRVVKA
jgi:hypothetical protein